MKKIEISSENVGGMSRLFLIPTDNVVRMIHNHSQNQWDIVLKSLDDNIEIETIDGFEFSETLDKNDDGDLYSVAITGFINGIDNEKSRMLQTLSYSLWMVCHIDSNGNKWLSGSVDVPLLFAYNRTSGKNGSDKNAASFSITGSQAEPSIPINSLYI